MLRIGMTNPPFILEHLKEIAEVLRHPCVYSFLHVPVQSGSDAVLTVSPEIYLTSFCVRTLAQFQNFDFNFSYLIIIFHFNIFLSVKI